MKKKLFLIFVLILFIFFMSIDNINAKDLSTFSGEKENNYLANGQVNYRYIDTNDIKFADKTLTAKYNLSVMSTMLARVSELLQKMSNGTNTDFDKEATLIEVNSLINHINLIYNTNIFSDKLFSKQDYDCIMLDSNKVCLNLKSLESTFPKNITDGSTEVVNMVLKQIEIVENDLNNVNSVANYLENNKIYGHNYSDFIYDQAQTLINYVQEKEGLLTEVHSVLQRQNELLAKLLNGTYESADFEAVKKEYIQLNDEHKRIVTNLLSDKMFLLNNKETIVPRIDDSFINFINMDLSVDNASQMIDNLKNMIVLVSRNRSILGAIQNTAEHYILSADTRFFGELTISKKNVNSDGVCFVGVFDENNNLINVFKTDLKTDDEVFTIYLPILDDAVTYSICETDEKGNKKSNSNLLLDKSKIVFSPDNLHEKLVITDKIYENPKTGIYGVLIVGIIYIIVVSILYLSVKWNNKVLLRK